MISDMNQKVPPLVESIKTITSNGNDIFSPFVKAGYLTESQKNTVVKELNNIEKLREEMKSIISTNHSIRESQGNIYQSGSNPFAAVLGGDIGSLIRLMKLKTFTESLEILKKELGPMMAEMETVTSILEMLNALGMGSNRAYAGKDMILVKGSGGSLIKVNISAAVRMFQQGNQLLEEKKRNADALISGLDAELMEGFASERTKVVKRIQEIVITRLPMQIISKLALPHWMAERKSLELLCMSHCFLYGIFNLMVLMQYCKKKSPVR